MANTSNAVSREETGSASAQGHANPPNRILVVEDDGDIRGFNAEVLRHSGYHVDTAEDGEAGWTALHAVSYEPDGHYDLLITDNDMPKVTGVELMRKLRVARMALPVIMATGTFPAQSLSQSPWLRPAATLLKPYTSNELLSTVRDVLHVTDRGCKQIAPRPDWQWQPSADVWQA